ncbi:ACC synthase [Coccidioides posadasii str. Silveira]|uniref:ACC synthase n=1 Tax=Coccidioides posadasii (strain RMSCC 757 / Silveira) TaxID=443226 RepID=E9D5C8_COCPS|nr:ACC synthase [Coccidioides posadasii str. Silveira]
MLSERGVRVALILKEPWKFPPSESSLYDKEKNPNGIISLATAENFLVHDTLEEYINRNISIPKAAFTYAYGSPYCAALTVPIARHINTHFKPCTPISSSHIVIANGVTAVNDLLGYVLADPNDAIMINRPIYGKFGLDFGCRGDVGVVYADTEPLEVFSVDVVKKYEEAIVTADKGGVKVRAMLITNPHNPLGRCYPPETLRELMRFCHRRNIHFISDEIYALSVFDSGETGTIPFTSALAIDPTGLLDENYIHVMYGMAKDFSAPGLKLGFLISKNADVRKGVACASRFGRPSGVSIAIASQMLNDEAFVSSYLSLCRETLARTYKFVTALLRENNIPYLPGSNAGYFVWIDLSAFIPPTTEQKPMSKTDREIALAERFVEAGVFLQPGDEQSYTPGWFRLVYTHEEEIVTEGIRRLVSSLKSLEWLSNANLN